MRIEYIHAPDSVDGSEGLLGIILTNGQHAEGAHFLTDSQEAMQVAYMHRHAGYKVAPHVHKPVRRATVGTQEVLVVKRGYVRVAFHTSDGKHVCDRTVGPGDVLVLVRGGHGLTMLSRAEFIEVKQGPYAGADDKRFL